MNKVTGKEMKKWLSDFDHRYYSIGLHHPHLIVPVTERDKEIFKAIMDAIENMDKKVGREFVEDWAESIAGDSAINDMRRARAKVKSLINQLGLEVEEEK